MAGYIKDKRLIVGLIILLAGVLLLLHEFSFFDWSFPRYFFSWKMLVIAIGIVLFLLKREGFILIGLGLVFLLPDIFPEHGWSAWQFWPIMLVAIGVSLLFRSRSDKKCMSGNCGKSVNESNGDLIDDVAVFGGGERFIYSQNFRGGKCFSFFGGSVINFTNAKLAEDHNILDITAFFGGTSFIIPDDWDVKIEVTALFGGFSDKRKFSRTVVPEPGKELHIKGLVIFGGGEIKSEL